MASADFIQGGNNRVILATDGDFNVGVTSDGEMMRLIEEKRKRACSSPCSASAPATCRTPMEKLADKGNGNYAYIDDLIEARRCSCSECGGTLLTIAKDVKIQVEFNPARVAAYRLIGYENRALARRGLQRRHEGRRRDRRRPPVTALYEIVPVGVALEASAGGRAALPGPRAPGAAAAARAAIVKIRYKEPDGDDEPLPARRRERPRAAGREQLPLRRGGGGVRDAAARLAAPRAGLVRPGAEARPGCRGSGCRWRAG